MILLENISHLRRQLFSKHLDYGSQNRYNRDILRRRKLVLWRNVICLLEQIFVISFFIL